MSTPIDFTIAPDGQHTLVTQGSVSSLDFTDPEYDDPASRWSRVFLHHVGLVQVAALPEAVRMTMGLGTSREAFKAMFRLINDELQDATWLTSKVRVDADTFPADATTYRDLDFVFPVSWPPPKFEFAIHRATTGDPTTGWPHVKAIY